MMRMTSPWTGRSKSMIGSVLYLTATRRDIHFAVCLCARFPASTHISHTHALKKIMRYPRFTPEFGLWYSSTGYSDADFTGCRLERKSTSRNCHFCGLYWFPGLRANSLMLLSLSQRCCSQLLCMMSTLRDFDLNFHPVLLLCDSTSVISVDKSPVLHSKTKHIDTSSTVGWHFHQTYWSVYFYTFCEGNSVLTFLFDRGLSFCFSSFLLLFI
jgi:hypothetical protein